VRVLRGAIRDVAVDLRRGSASYARHVAVDLSAADGRQLLVPAGFAHGYVTLEPDTEVLLKVDAPPAPGLDGGVAYDDPDLAIDWGLGGAVPILSDKDRAWPRLRDLPAVFA
jgi:dTDP-4-dehydrorhamnose 3,5-epimerase